MNCVDDRDLTDVAEADRQRCGYMVAAPAQTYVSPISATLLLNCSIRTVYQRLGMETVPHTDIKSREITRLQVAGQNSTHILEILKTCLTILLRIQLRKADTQLVCKTKSYPKDCCMASCSMTGGPTVGKTNDYKKISKLH
ncbi:hypothetical protein DPMN_027948 [Dreissena polymorpha]|uniref:Uncharacterized protein n=1 Tax=Dreissena polymorpha TaxID=45954 RepID=A0A9D4RG01_DREPO|nr:hypothetical protein DPMN_027948 [Dreissena polymorpha]